MEVLLPVDGHQLDQLVAVEGGLVHGAAAVPRVDERAEAHLGVQAGPAGRDLTPQMDDAALGQGVALQLVRPGQIQQSESAADVGAGPLGHKALSGFAQMGDALLLPVAHGAALLDVQVAGMPRLLEAVADGEGDLLRPAGQSLSADADRGVIRDHPGGFRRRNEFCHILPSRSYSLFVCRTASGGPGIRTFPRPFFQQIDYITGYSPLQPEHRGPAEKDAPFPLPVRSAAVRRS